MEYRNLIQSVKLAYEESRWDLCWRIAARLGECVDADTSPVEVNAAFRSARKAAEQSTDAGARMDVLLARGSYLSAVEQYDEAHHEFRGVIEAASRARLDTRIRQVADEMSRREAAAWRKLGESHIQMAAFSRASEMLEQALALAQAASDEEGARLTRLLQAESHRVDSSSPSYGAVLDDSTDDRARFRAHLVLSESERRRGNSREAEAHLTLASRYGAHNARSVANVHYRFARLYIERYKSLVQADRHETAAAQAAAGMIRHAASSSVMFQRISDPLGVVRARALLGRALAEAGFSVEADHFVSLAERGLEQVAGDASPACDALRARVLVVKSELVLKLGRSELASELLREAADVFASNGDWAEERYSQRLRRAIQSVPQAGQSRAMGSGPESASAGIASSAQIASLEESFAALAERQADRIVQLVATRMSGQIRQPADPPPPAAFVGLLGVGIAGARDTTAATDSPSWQIRTGSTCDLAVLVATGQSYYSSDGRSLPPLPGVSIWREVAVKSGVAAPTVELELVIDAPFVRIPVARTTAAVPVENGRVPHRTTLRCDQPGRYDLRVALYSAGRLVQALPIEIIAVAAE